jgi:hypothetical protein
MIRTIDFDSETEPLDIQRWEDEGGLMNEHNEFMTERLLAEPVPIKVSRHDRFQQWNERFVIELFQPGNGTFWIRKKQTTKIDSS